MKTDRRAPSVAGGGSSPVDIDERIRRLEVEERLLDFTVDGWCAWCLLRFPVQSNAARNLAGVLPRRDPGAMVATALRDIPALLTPRPARYLVKTYTSGLAEFENGAYRDVYFDDLILALGDCTKLETINSPLFLPRRARARIRSHCTTTLFSALAALPARAGLPRSIGRTAAALGERLKGALDLPWIARRLRGFYWMKRAYAGLLGRLRPRAVLIIDASEHALIAASREAGIPVVEVQHGIVDRFHSSYSWTSHALPYRDRMPVPDRLFLFGEHWKRELDVHGFWGSALRVVGSPRMDRERTIVRPRPAGGRRSLVFTTQGIATDEVVAFLKAFLDAPLDVVLTLKIHPVYAADAQAFRAAFGSDARVRIVSADEGPSTLELIRRSDLHLSISSACHYEALGIGVPTVVLALPSHELVMHLCESGHASLARTPDDLVGIVRGWRAMSVPEAVGRTYYEPDALANMKRELEALSV